MSARFRASSAMGSAFSLWVRTLKVTAPLHLIYALALTLPLVFLELDEPIEDWILMGWTFGAAFGFFVLVALISPFFYPEGEGKTTGWVIRSGWKRFPSMGLCALLCALIPTLALGLTLLSQVLAEGMPGHRQDLLLAVTALAGVLVGVPLSLHLSLAPALSLVGLRGGVGPFKLASKLARGRRSDLLSLYSLLLLAMAGISTFLLIPLRMAVDDLNFDFVESGAAFAVLLAFFVLSGLATSVVGAAAHELRLEREGRGLQALLKVFQ